MLRVDCQSHLFPQTYAELLKRNRGELRASGGDGVYVVTYGQVQKFTIDLAAYAPEKKIRDMDAAGIDVSILSVNMPGPERLDLELGLEGARICNDYVAEVCARYPGRLAGLAVLPLQDVPTALQELDRAIDVLGLRGVVLYSHLGGQPVDAPQFEPFYQRAEEKGVPLVLHPTVPTWADAIADYSMIPMFGLMVDTSIAMLRLILSGVMERHPALQIVHPHVGGVLPYLMGRVVEQTEVKRRGREHIKRSPAEYYQRVYLDMVSPSALALRYGYDFAGPDKLLFGTDHPWIEMPAFVQLVESLPIPTQDMAKILGENAARLFRL
jgi:predicted TIM-barrel fold metal-dependent hydrolase